MQLSVKRSDNFNGVEEVCSFLSLILCREHKHAHAHTLSHLYVYDIYSFACILDPLFCHYTAPNVGTTVPPTNSPGKGIEPLRPPESKHAFLCY